MTTTIAEDRLRDLGFSAIEARVYCELVRAGPATGYRLARAVGKAPANTYQALESLLSKGAVIVDDGEARTWRAAAPGELLAGLKAAFDRRGAAALAALSTIDMATPDDRLYALKSRDQVLAKARAMIAGASSVVLFDLFPEPFEALRQDLETAAAAGIVVAGLVYGPTETTVRVAITGSAPEAAGRWPGQQVTLAADAREHLVALLAHEGDQVLRGLWSDSAYLACLQHSALSSEIRLSALPPGDDPFADVALLTLRPPGLTHLLGDRS